MEALWRRRWHDFPNGRDQIFRALVLDKGERLVLDDNFSSRRWCRRALSAVSVTPRWTPLQALRSAGRTSADADLAAELPIEGEPADVVAVVECYGARLAHRQFRSSSSMPIPARCSPPLARALSHLARSTRGQGQRHPLCPGGRAARDRRRFAHVPAGAARRLSGPLACGCADVLWRALLSPRSNKTQTSRNRS